MKKSITHEKLARTAFLRFVVFFSTLIPCFPGIAGIVCAASEKPVESSWQGSATGSFTVNGKTVNLKYAYAMEEQDAFDEKETVISVLLTTEPLSKDVFNTEKLYFAVDKSKPSIIYSVDKTGKTNHETILHPGIEGGGIQRSGITSGVLTFKTKAAKSVVGAVAVNSSKPSFQDFKYAVKVSFKAPLMQGQKKAPTLNASTGTSLPDDGGEPGKSLREYISAIHKDDLDTIKKIGPDGARKASAAELKQAVEIFKSLYPKNLKIIRGFIKEDVATLYVSSSDEDGVSYGAIGMKNKKGFWGVDIQKWSDKPFD